jgi:hypothetical protein
MSHAYQLGIATKVAVAEIAMDFVAGFELCNFAADLFYDAGDLTANDCNLRPEQPDKQAHENRLAV